MKTLKLMFAAGAALLLSVSALAAPSLNKVVFSADHKTMTFESTPGIPVGVDSYLISSDASRGEDDYPAWHVHASLVTKVVFDSTFAPVSPTRCDKWFADFENLETIEGITNLKTANVTLMNQMFSGCTNLKRLDLSGFNTASVTDMSSMFSGCTGLKVLNLRNFDMANVDEMGEMFYGCSSLRRIIGPMKNIKTTGNVESASMFEGCTELVGGYGTEYNIENVGKEYAQIDADGNPGYLSYTPTAYYDASAAMLTFSYGENPPLVAIGDETYLVADAEMIDSVHDYVEWFGKRSSVTKIVFDGTFANYKPLQCGAWFFQFGNLTEISNLENLDTSMVKDFAYMFEGCSKLTTIDVFGFDTANATTMREMFYECSKLTELDLSSFDTYYVTDMQMMFKNCTDLKKIYVGVDFVAHEETVCGSMFCNCNNLVGEKGTAYSAVTDPEKDGEKYAHIDQHPSWPTPGYFSAVPVAVLSDDGETLTFYADGDLHKGEGQAVYSVLEAGERDPIENPPWYDDCHADVAKVEFDPSFANFRPKHCGCWFFEFESLERVVGTKYLDTSAATDLQYMFAYCGLLAELDFSHQDTANVANMRYMFIDCESLKRLDLSGFDTAKVTNMCDMFHDCSALESVSLIGFDTSKVTNMSDMFNGCSSLTELDLSSIDTAKVTEMTGMFAGCSSLKKIYAPNFTLKSGVESQSIFSGCTALRGDSGTIYDGGNVTALYARKDGGVGTPGYFTKPLEAKAVLEDAGTTLRFVYDNADHGVKGTAWYSVADAGKLDPSAKMPWYAAAGTVTKVVFDESFFAYAPRHCGSWFRDFPLLTEIENSEYLNLSSATSLAYMFLNCGQLKYVTFDSPDRGSKVTSMLQMFDGCSKLESVYLDIDTASLTTMELMFSGCQVLKEIEYYLDTSKVTTMQSMFYGCEALKALDLGGFDTSSVTTMGFMFMGCKNLAMLNLGSFDTRKVTNMESMFNECSALKSLDLTSFKTAAVTTMNDMFNNCTDIERIYASPAFVTTGLGDPSLVSMFSDCTKLRGGKGTTYADVLNYSATYAKLDGGESDRGFFTVPPVVVLDGTKLTFYNDGSDHAGEGEVWSVASALPDPSCAPKWNAECGRTSVTTVEFDPSFVTFKPEHCGSWFSRFTALTGIMGLEYLDVSEATSLVSMFGYCSVLTTLDLSTFDTAKAKSIESMFEGCSNLRRIYVSESFVTTGLSGFGSGNMVFAGCDALVGGNDTAYVGVWEDGAAYARIDAPGTPGYFTKAGPRTVTLDPNGGEVSPATLTPTVDTAVGTLPTPTRKGYDFAGWWTLAEGGDQVAAETVVTKDVAFHAHWTLHDYVIAYELAGGVNAAANPATYTVETPDITLAAPTREGYTFKGWTPDGVIAKGSTGDRTFAAAWAQNGGDTPVPGPDPDKLTVTFDANGGTVGETSRQVPQGDKVGALPTPVYAGHAFLGWFTAASGGDRVGAETPVTVAVTYFAHWEAVAAGKKVVTFDAGNGAVGEVSRQVTVGGPVGTLPVPVRTGYEFKGWFDRAAGGTPITADTLVTESFAAYAQWQIVAYPIAVDLAGGTMATPAPTTYTVEDAVTLGTPMRDRYTFRGWTPDGGRISKGSTGAKAFTAQWQRVYPTLFDASEAGGINPKGATYNGFIGGEADLGGTFTLVVKKSKDGIADATMTLVDAITGKKTTVKGKVDIESGDMTGDLAGLELSGKAVGGTLGDENVQGAVDAAKAKDREALAVMNAFNKRSYAFVLEDEDGGLVMLTATFSAKGKVKVAGTVDGAKLSGSAQMSVGDRCAVPFVWSKKGAVVSFVLWFDKATKALVDVSGLGDGTDLVAFGQVAPLAAGDYRFKMEKADVLASLPAAIAETPLDVEILFTGKKFDAGKAAKVTYDKRSGELVIDTTKGDNVSGLTLKYNKGALSGSFTVYSIANNKLVKSKFTVSGLVVDGVGYATATCKKLRSIPVTLVR